jgi:hypothetical protein
MSISDRVLHPARLGNFVQSTYKHNIVATKRKVNLCFCIAAMLFLHILKTKGLQSFIWSPMKTSLC